MQLSVYTAYQRNSKAWLIEPGFAVVQSQVWEIHDYNLY